MKTTLPFLGNFNVIYLADTEYNPLGLKSEGQLMDIVSSWITLCINGTIKPKLVILACNTASIIYFHTREMQDNTQIKVLSMVDGFKKLIHDYASEITNKNVAIMGTLSTINSGFYQETLRPVSPKMLTEIIGTRSECAVASASFNTNKGKKEIADELSAYESVLSDTVILACTCFNCIKHQIARSIGPHATFLDPVDSLVKIVRDLLVHGYHSVKDVSDVIYLNSGDKERNAQSRLLSKEIMSECVDFQNIHISRKIRDN
ncbi:MAG: aspartate/glutamate racemase family protein [bacterium]|nr:aspartate/glutamate racemase family protein [bacterium]